MLKLTGLRPATGFHLRLENGWTVSVQMGPGTYSDHHDADFNFDAPERTAELMTRGSHRVEIATWPDSDVMFPLSGDGDSVDAYVRTAALPDLFVRVAALPRTPDLRDREAWTDSTVESVARQRMYSLERVFLYEDVRAKMLPSKIDRLRELARDAIDACRQREIEFSVPDLVAADLGIASVAAAPSHE